MIHELKTWSIYYGPISEGLKTFEFRFEDDRKFEVGDLLLLKEFNATKNIYTGRELMVEVIYLTRLEALDTGLSDNAVIMSIKKLK